MGTNFYWKEKRHEDENNILQHIGKKSAAGWYCYSCGTTLNRGGVTMVHRSKRGGVEDILNVWLDECPSCGEKKDTEKFFYNQFSSRKKSNEENDSRRQKKGVASCSSFTWTIMKHKWEIEELTHNKSNKKVILDEYGEGYTAKEFLKELESCPIEFQSPSEFS